MTEIVTRETVLQPLTGELIPAGDVPKLAEAIQEIRDYRDKLGRAIDALTEALINESHRQGTKTLTAAGLKIEVSADTQIDWDIDELDKLRDAGLPGDRYAQLVQTIVTHKVDGRVAKQLEGANDAYATIIDRARVRVPKKQYVTVKRA